MVTPKLQGDRKPTRTIDFKGKQVNKLSIHVDGIDMKDYPDFCDAHITYAEYTDGTALTEEEVVDFDEDNYGLVNELIHDNTLYI